MAMEFSMSSRLLVAMSRRWHCPLVLNMYRKSLSSPELLTTLKWGTNPAGKEVSSLCSPVLILIVHTLWRTSWSSSWAPAKSSVYRRELQMIDTLTFFKGEIVPRKGPHTPNHSSGQQDVVLENDHLSSVMVCFGIPRVVQNWMVLYTCTESFSGGQ